MNLFKIGMTGLLVGGLLTGCGTTESSKPGEENKVKEEEGVKNNVAKAEEVDSKEWKDLSMAGDLEKTRF